MEAHLAKYWKEFEKHMSEVDALALIVLKAHLIIEGILDNIVALIFFHPEHVLRGRFGFEHKMQMVRAFALRKNKDSMWNLIAAVNELRNAIAHSLTGDRREVKIAQVKRMFFAEASPEIANLQEGKPDNAIVLLACGMCAGYLATLEDDSRGLRRFIDGLDAVLNAEDAGDGRRPSTRVSKFQKDRQTRLR